MSGLKTVFVALLVLSQPLRAMDTPLIATFASCTGRFSAELEHAWLINDTRTAEIEHRRLQFIDLLDATVPPDARPDMLNLRIQAKVAHAGLLSQALFSQDADRSAWALRRAQSEISYCAGFLLDS
ncbi:MAG: hypothetical protein HKN27_03525 [Silicimonas sp.]|nr:hypothetical protein [Silicimonas sp.]